MKPVHVLIADDHPKVRKGISNLLQRDRNILVVGEAEDGLQALKLAKKLKPQVLILDMEMPGLNGVEVARRLGDLKLPVNILVLSAYDDKQYILELLSLGAVGYFLKDEVSSGLIEAVHGVVRGEYGWFSPSIADRVARWYAQEALHTPSLELRERETLDLLANGLSADEIGEAIGIQQNTVAGYLRSIFAKLDEKYSAKFHPLSF